MGMEMIEIGLLLWRAYSFIAIILIINVVARTIFQDDTFVDSEKDNIHVGKTLLFIPVWPLAIFSPHGRKVIFMRVNKL